MLTLEAKTRRGKNKLAEAVRAVPLAAGTWEVLKVFDCVAFSRLPGPWLLVSPFSAPHGDFSRWVHETDDRDFVVRHNAQVKPPAAKRPAGLNRLLDDNEPNP